MLRSYLAIQVLFASGLTLLAFSVRGQVSKDDAGFLDEFIDWDGEELAKQHCVLCHQYPDPDLLPRESWPYVLNLMGLYYGYDDGRLLRAIDEATQKDLFDVDEYPSKPTLSPFQWAAIRDYYEQSEGAIPSEPLDLGVSLDLFEPTLVYGSDETPISSLVKVLPSEEGGFYIGNAEVDLIDRFDGSGKLIESLAMTGSIVQLEREAEREWATIIGRMHPSNTATGSIAWRVLGSKEWQMIVPDLHRPVHVLTDDLDGDGSKEWVISEFGHYLGGRLSVLSAAHEGGFKTTVLRNEPGAISAAVYREESDGLPHLIALNAQARQDVIFYRNLGDLSFQAEILLQKPPAFGYTQMKLLDLTGDGIQELVTINGDNADLPGPPLKDYHGVRVYRINPGPELEELLFLPMAGAFQATFGDFDGNGLTDIAAVSFFPDPRRPEQGFAYFRNAGNLEFQRQYSEVGALAPWMTIDSGDIDGDGDSDILLGSAFLKREAPGDGQGRLPSGAILWNQLKSPN